MIYRFAFIFSAIILLIGCKTGSVRDIERFSANAPNAITYLLEELKTKRMIFINEEEFIIKHLQEFYDAGIHYLFYEGNLSSESRFLASYPWMNTGSAFELELFTQDLVSFEESTLNTDPFRIISAEKGLNTEGVERDDDYNWIISWLNYRDENVFKNITEILDNASSDVKTIVYFGGKHGAITKSVMS